MTCKCHLHASQTLFLSPEERAELADIELDNGEVISLLRLLGAMGLGDFQRLGCSRKDIDNLTTLHTGLHFIMTEQFGTDVMNSELG
jgi:hypothetical protein